MDLILFSHSPKKAEFFDKHIRTEYRDDVIERILPAYYLTEENFKDRLKLSKDMWTEFIDNHFKEAFVALQSRNVRQFIDWLHQINTNYIDIGGLTLTSDSYLKTDDSNERASLYKDKLICLAEALGVLSLENLEARQWWTGYDMERDVDIDWLIDQIEKEIGISLSLPKEIYVAGLLTNNHGIFHYRQINAIYTAYRIASLVKKSVCEYGGGLGLVALYARRLGVSDYTIFELPLVSIFTANFLITALGEDAITLYGEKKKPNSISILPFWCCLEQDNDKFELCLNQDSFAEISERIVKKYLDEISRTVSRYFLSINQETNLNVSRILKDDKRYKRTYRFLYWIRRHYIEELYEIQK